jgi:hypothetical protein
MIEAHGSLPDSAYWEYYFNIYGDTQAMAIRRQGDQHPDVASLAKLLAEVDEDAEALTPEWWIGLWSIEEGDTYERAYARSQWDQEFGGEVGDHLDRDLVAADLERLISGSERVKTHVDKHIAHSEDPGPEPKDPGPAPARCDRPDRRGIQALLPAVHGREHGHAGAGHPARLAGALPRALDSPQPLGARVEAGGKAPGRSRRSLIEPGSGRAQRRVFAKAYDPAGTAPGITLRRNEWRQTVGQEATLAGSAWAASWSLWGSSSCSCGASCSE